MTVREIAALMRPQYEAAVTREERLAVQKRWDDLLEAAEPEPPQPDGLEETLERVQRTWERRARRQRRA